MLPLGVLLLPAVLLAFAGLMCLAFYLGKYKILSQGKFFAAYWIISAILEILYIIVFVDGVQFIPPSFFVSYAYGTVFLILYTVQCVFSKNRLSVKLTYIGGSIALNYFVIPMLLIFIPLN